MSDAAAPRRALLAILSAALAVRLGLLIFYLAGHGWKGETWEYEDLARNLLQGQGYVLESRGAVYLSYLLPVFPLLCYGLHWIWGPGLGLFYAFQLAVGLGVVILTYRLTHRCFGPRAAFLAGWLAALEPGLVVYHSYKVDVNAFAGLLLLLALDRLLESERTPGDRNPAAAGLLIGAGCLTRPDIVILLAVPALWLLLDGRDRAAGLRKAAVVVLAVAAVAAPWVLRNYLVHRRFILTTTTVGEILWTGNNPNATGTAIAADGRGMYEAAPEEFRRRIESSGELGQNDIFMAEALRHIAADPGAFARRCAGSFAMFWWFGPSYASSRHYSWIPGGLSGAYKFLHAALLVLVAAGAWRAFQDGAASGSRRAALLMLSVPLANALLHVPYYTEGRHRVLVMPILLAFAALGADSIWYNRPGHE